MSNPNLSAQAQGPQTAGRARHLPSTGASESPGVALYEPRFGPYTRALDFAVWLKGVGRFGLEGKGGQHRYENATWWLTTPAGLVEQECPALQAWDSTHGFQGSHRAEAGQRSLRPGGVGIPRHGAGPQDQRGAGRQRGPRHLRCGGSHRQAGRAGPNAQVLPPPTAADIKRETALVWGAEPEPEAPGPYAPGLDDRQVIIQHVEHLHIHTAVVEGL